jgi:hypothetical protein
MDTGAARAGDGGFDPAITRRRDPRRGIDV